MSSISITSNPTYASLDPADSVRANGSRLFFAATTLLITVVYMMPLGQNWTTAIEENYGASAEALESAAESGQFSRQVGLATLGLFGLAGLAWPGGHRLRLGGPVGLVCIAYFAWIATSCLWAEDFMLSFRRVVGATCEVAAALAIAKRSSPRQLVWTILIATTVWLCVGLVAELSISAFRPGTTDYRFCGLDHPNNTAIVCALLIMSIAYLYRGSKHVWPLLGLAAFAAILLWLTRSRTAIATMLLTYGTIWVITTSRRKAAFTLMAGAWAAALLLVVLGSETSEVANNAITMGRADSDAASLTGRLPLWRTLSYYAADHPILGYGYSGFWTAYRVASFSDPEWGFIASAHSMYLEMVLSVGVVGMLLCVAALVLSLARAIRLERQFPQAGFGMVAILLCFILVCGLLESTFGVTGYLSLFALAGICFVVFRDDVPTSNQPRPRRHARAAVQSWIQFGTTTSDQGIVYAQR